LEFNTDAQRAAYERLKGWVSQMFGESAWTDDQGPSFGCPVGAYNVVVGVEPLGDDRAVLDLWTWPVPEGEVKRIPEDAIRSMLEMNAKYRFGALNIQANGVIVLEYVVAADGLTKDLFEHLLWMVSGSASEIREELAPKLQ
jgi:hypothetical protein